MGVELRKSIESISDVPNPTAGWEAWKNSNVTESPVKIISEPVAAIDEVLVCEGLELISCVKCDFCWENAGASLDEILYLTLDSGERTSDSDAIHHYKNHRFRCQNCETVFCAQCKASPYHIGMDCQTYQIRQSSKPCRFCKAPVIKPENELFVVCESADCVNYSSQVCKTTRKCGHACCISTGHTKECNEMNCLEPECTAEKISPLDCTHEDLCSICWTEELSAKPIIQLGCGHSFHKDCMRAQIQKSPGSGPISIKHLCCPLCDKMIEEDYGDSDMHHEIHNGNRTRIELIQRSLRQLQIDNITPPEDVKDPGVYAMDLYNYYNCEKCRSIYYGGKRECGESLRDLPDAHYICDGCRGCPHHDGEDLVFKCRFCCSIAVWFCFGHTHFCEPCHSRWTELADVGNQAILAENAKIGICSGPDTCPLGIAHAPNGQEFLIGCRACDDELMHKPKCNTV